MSDAAFLEEWHRIVAEKDLDALEHILEEDVRLGPPPYWAKLEGRPVVHFLLGLILETLEDFRYHREWSGSGQLALEFFAHVGDLELQGVDLISLSEAGRIAEIDVVMRPVEAVQRLQELVTPKMAAYFERQSDA